MARYALSAEREQQHRAVALAKTTFNQEMIQDG
jgi:hypothetical protein